MKKMTLALFVASTAFLAATILAQEHQHESHQAHGMTTDQAKTDECERMMAMQNQLISDMRAKDERLNDLVDEMDAAQDNKKLYAVAEVVKELVAQRAEIQSQMMEYHGEMMKHMGNHMSMMTSMDGTDSTKERCSMMMGMMGGSRSHRHH